MPKIFGLTGYAASGKDVVADHLISLGYKKISMSDFLREEMTKLDIPTDRTHIQEFVIAMRAKHGNGYLALETIKRIEGNTVIGGVRNSEEIKIFREAYGKDFVLIGLHTSLEIRYQRALLRGRIGDHISFEQFCAEEEKERSQSSGSLEIEVTLSLADMIFDNDGSMEDLHKKVDTYLASVNSVSEENK